NKVGSGKFIGIKYTGDILNKLTTTELLNLERSNEIKIEVISVDDITKIVQMKISINVEINGEVISSERIFDKLQWMHP
ncbi:MAG: type II secretion system protein, partial [Clostridium sp.]